MAGGNPVHLAGELDGRDRHMEGAVIARGVMAQSEERVPLDAQLVPVPAHALEQLVTREGPDHAPRFVVEVSVSGEGSETAEGRTKQEAQQSAARAMLARLERQSA